MKLGLIIASRGRPEILRKILEIVVSQARKPDYVVISAVDSADVPELRDQPRVEAIFGRPGLTAQRNNGLSRLIDKADLVVFIDDDFIVGDDFFEDIETFFKANPDVSAATGKVIADGAGSQGYTFEDGIGIAQQYRLQPPNEAVVIRNKVGTYGCNMGFRCSAIGTVRFDERLPLYGWQEDLDFSGALRQTGRIVWTNQFWGVHLGTKSGKASEVKFGYSQIINPLYIARKGNMPYWYALWLVGKNILANLVKSARPEMHVDRRGRLRGNLIGLYHLMSGRLTPEYILELR